MGHALLFVWVGAWGLLAAGLFNYSQEFLSGFTALRLRKIAIIDMPGGRVVPTRLAEEIELPTSGTRTQPPAHGRRAKIRPQHDRPQHDPDGIELRVVGRHKRRPPAHFEYETPTGRIGGHLASQMFARRQIERDQSREKLRVAAAMPKNIEKRLADQRARGKRGSGARGSRSCCPNPVRAVRQFMTDPVTRFWLGCNVFCILLLLLIVFLFMSFLYPLAFRPIFKY